MHSLLFFWGPVSTLTAWVSVPSEVDVRVSDLATSSMVILLIKDVGLQRIQINDSRM